MLEATRTPAIPESSITYINSDNSHRFQPASPPAGQSEGDPVDLDHSVQFVKYVDPTPHWHPDMNSPAGTGDACLVAGFSTGLAIIAPSTYEILYRLSYEDSPLAGAYAVAQSSIPSKLNVVTGNTFNGTVLVHAVTVRRTRPSNLKTESFPLVGAPLDYVVSRTAAEHVKGDWYKSVYQSCMVELSKLGIRTMADLTAAGDITYPVTIPPYVQHALDEVKNGGPDCSPSFALPYSCVFDAKSPLKPAIAAAAERRSTTKAVKRPPRPGGLVDLPVTFHSKVKSSGYISRPWAAPKKAIKPIQQRLAALPLDAEKAAEVIPLQTLAAVNHGAAITALDFSPSGLALATASADRSVRYHKPPTKDPPKTLLGHDGPLNSVGWSKLSSGIYNQLLLTSSMDGSARLWSVQQSEPLFEIRQLQARSAPRFTHTNITNARFFYQDRLIVIPSGRKMYFYSYALQKFDRASVKPLLNYNSYRQSTAFSTSAQTVSAFACVNTRPSHVVVMGASDKSLSLWDVAQCRVVQTIENAQERAVHTIALADYEHCTPGADFETTFFTSAVCQV
ncbi:WD repeat-containing protein 27 [Geranomyces variabilis]|uniref:WD repeat-containing protein 27 n=1 Tax=Geranomyces variabilis TaxID=109894 RepID=A0AAD5TIU2_9FUNG|nr:WD repeat-containing protein 27 [Geranomyces variabilis]